MALPALPAPSPDYDVFGLDLTSYMTLPGVTLQVNKYGFDSMRRHAIIKTANILAAQDALIGLPDREFPTMFITRVIHEEQAGPWTTVDLEFEGRLSGDKPTELSVDADTRKTSINIFYGILIVNWQIEVSEVTVQAVYIQDTAPDLNVAGDAASQIGGQGTGLTPPISIDDPSLDSLNTALNLVPGTLQIFKWYWVLRRRAVRFAGVPPAPLTTRRLIPGTVSLIYNERHVVSATQNGQFNTTLLPGKKIFATNPPAPGPDVDPRFATGFTIASIDNNNSAQLDTIFSGNLFQNFDGRFFSLDPLAPPPGASPTVLYEVTDSWKRVVLIRGEPIANALSQ